MPSEGAAILQRITERSNDIVDVDRRQLSVRAGQRHWSGDLQQRGKTVKEAVVGSEDHRWSKARYRDVRLAERVRPILAFTLGSQIDAAAGGLIGVQCAHVKQALDLGGVAG